MGIPPQIGMPAVQTDAGLTGRPGVAASSVSCSTRAATLTAIAAGSFERMPVMPIGVDTRARSSSPSPASRSSFWNRAHFEREPMSPIEPRPGVRSAASHDREVLDVVVGHDEHVRARREVRER